MRNAFVGSMRAVVVTAMMAACAAASEAQNSRAQSASESYARAESLVRAHEWDQGLAMLEGLLKRYPADAKILNLTGLAYTGKGDLPKADSFFQRALRARPDFLASLKNLGINEFTLQEFPAAEKHLKLAAERAPEDPVVNLYLGQLAYRERDFAQSAERLSRAEAIVAHEPNLRAMLGISQLQSGKKDAALVEFDELSPEMLAPKSQFEAGLALAQANLFERATPYLEAVQRTYPDSYNPGFDLAICYIGAKRYVDAIALVKTLLGRGIETDELNNLLAEAYEGNHETQLAVDALRRAIALNPEDDDNYLDFANICIDHHDFDTGLKVISVGLDVHPKSYRLIFERGVLYAMEDRFNLAESDFQQSSRLEPESNFGFVGMGVTFLETGDAAQAIALLRKRLREKPNDPSLLYLLGEALMRNGAKLGTPEYTEAQVSLEKSVQLNPNLCLPHVALGEIYVDEERYGDAVAQLEQARAIDPKEKSAYSHLAVAYRRLGKIEDAKRILNLLKEVHQRERGWARDQMKDETQGSSGTANGHPG